MVTASESLRVSMAHADRGDAGATLEDPAARLRRAVDDHYDFLWRSARRLGVPEAAVDDALQHVFLVAAQKLAGVAPDRERSFLFGTVMRVAANVRRAERARREVLVAEVPEDGGGSVPSPERLLEDERARALLDEVVEQLPMDLRAVFVLFELEELSTAQIAALLELPAGTVASRLRRAREEFEHVARRVKRALAEKGRSS